MFPALWMLPLGSPKLTWLNALNASARNYSVTLSLIEKFLKADISTL